MAGAAPHFGARGDEATPFSLRARTSVFTGVTKDYGYFYMAQFDYHGTVSGVNKSGTPAYYETLDNRSSFAKEGWIMQYSQTCERNGRLFYNFDMNTNVVVLITDWRI